MNLKKILKQLSGGQGSDHFSPSQLLLPLPKWMINYLCCTQEQRRESIVGYKAHYGNYVNNTAQRLTAKYLYVGDKKIELVNRDRATISAEELAEINKHEPKDEKDKWSRQFMLEFAEPTITQAVKAIKEIFGENIIQSEFYQSHRPEGLMMDILGRIDYESNNVFAEMKSKPPNVRKLQAGYKLITQKLPDEPEDNHIAQVAFYWMACRKRPTLFYVNHEGYKIFDYTHEKLQFAHLEYMYAQMVKKAQTIQNLLVLTDGDAKKMAQYVEAPDFNHPFYYKDLTEDQQKITKELWG